MQSENDSLTAPSERSHTLALWLRDYAGRKINSRLIDERRCIPPYIVLDFGRRGLLGMQIPAEQGGLLEFNHREFFWTLRQLGAIDFTLAAFVGLNNCLGVRPILRFGNKTMRDRYLPELATGRTLGSFAITEAGAGSNPADIAAIAQRMPHGFTLNGEKWWAGSAQWAGVINVIARHHDANRHHCGFVALCIDGEAAGLRQGEEALTLGLRGMVQNKVHFNDIKIAEECILGSPYAGMSVASDTMNFGRVTIAAVSAGAIWRLLQLMIRYTSRRQIGGTLLYNNDHIQSLIAESWNAARAVDAMVQGIATELDNGTALPTEIYAAAKFVSTELLWSTADTAMQILGGRAYCENNPVAQIWRDARITRVFEGPSETIATYLGQQILREGCHLRKYLHANNLECNTRLELERTLTLWQEQKASASPRQLVALGEAVAWTLLGKFSSTSNDLQNWIAKKCAHASERIFTAPRLMLPDAASLTNFIAGQIGSIQQTLAGEHTAPDAYFYSEDFSATRL